MVKICEHCKNEISKECTHIPFEKMFKGKWIINKDYPCVEVDLNEKR